MNKKPSLDLYAKIEPLIGFYREYERLYNKYLQIVISLKPNNILDFGCGNGRLLEKLKEHKFDAVGIDLSSAMVEKALLRGVRAYQKNIKEVNENFDVIIASADVLNYLNKSELSEVLNEIFLKLTPKGYFLADINTLYGFTHVADGLLIKETKDCFLTVEANFQNKKLLTNFTFFEQNGEYYKKEQAIIEQYFYPLEYFKKLKLFRLKTHTPVYLFDRKTPDKNLMIFQKNS
ncbi:MAG: class I SAM-dependent methyltransferase [Campylobacteraceae bacterium]|jgi:SAM-dependent methyltransferase|nr:class I SAM-dependent methyltransferase [Campylobacteraceae bacterium]